jgi:hypothetical protein
MAHKKLNEEEKALATKSLINFREWLKEKSHPEKVMVVIGLYKKVFSQPTIEESSFVYGLEQIKRFYLYKPFLFKLNKDELELRYKNELRFLEESNSMKSVPSYILRLLVLDYLENLEGRTRTGISGLDKESPEFKEYKTRIEVLYSSTGGSDDDNLINNSISKEFIEDFLSKPFFNIDLKFLLLRCEDPNDRKGLKSIIYQGYQKAPYSATDRKKLAALIEDYCFLSAHFGMGEDIKALEKRKLPVSDARVFDLILENGYQGNKNQLLGDLRKIFLLKQVDI